MTLVFFTCLFFVMLSYVSRLLFFFFHSRKKDNKMRKANARNMEGRRLVDACRAGRWEDAKTMISMNPSLVCTASDEFGDIPAYWVAWHDDVDLLQHMLDAILLLSLRQRRQQQLSQEEEGQRRQQMLRDAFERGNNHGYTPVLVAAEWGHVQCLAFLVEHTPCGAAVLEVKSRNGDTAAHCAAHFGHVDALDFIVRNAPGRSSSGFPIPGRSSSGFTIPGRSSSGAVGVLEVKNNRRKTPLDNATDEAEQQVVEYIDNIKNRLLPSLSSSNFQRYVGDLQNYP
jgi:hypothetical protein